jgi:uncharacterized repeat protein (TIGR01451 family)
MAWMVAITAATLAVSSAPAQAQGELRRIDNRAEATYMDANGNQGSAEAAATVFVSVASEVRVSPDYQVQVNAGERRVLRHWVTNAGDWVDQFFITVTGAANWARQVFQDRDGDGLLSAADAVLDGSFSLAGGDSIPLLLVMDIPADQRDTTGVTLEFRATSLTDAAATAAARDVFAVSGSTQLLTIQKSVDRSEATVGDTLVYTIAVANTGNAPAAGIEFVDLLPRGVRYVPGTVLLAASISLSAAGGGDAITTTEDGGRQTLRIALAPLVPGAAGTVTIRTIIVPGAGEVLSNTASLKYGNTEITSNTVETRLTLPQLTLGKRYVGTAQVPVGAELRYTLEWSNAVGNAPVYAATLTDTLVDELEFISAQGAPEVDGRVLRWNIGTIAPGTSGSVELMVRVLARSADGRIPNRADLSAANASASANAGIVMVAEPEISGLEVTKQASVLEASLGESVTYAVVIRNSGSTILRDLVARDRLPEGTRLRSERVTGADSVRVSGRDVSIWMGGDLAPGESRPLSYSLTIVVAPARGTLDNVIRVEANGGTVRSDEATASVRVRSGFVMESRTIIGKVWFDADGDGRQGPTEYGVGNVDVWSADGNVVTTDREGRFSFRNLTPGTHTLRMDMLAVPEGMGLAARGDETVRVRADGWTTPVVSFRLVNAPVERRTSARTEPANFEATTPAVLHPARTAEERGDEERQSFVGGPVVRIASPNDGSVLATHRIYIGVRGEAGADVRLFNGDSLISTGTLRPDGVADFVAVGIPEGTSMLRVAMSSTWGSERWDSVRVHRTGLPARIEVPREAVTVTADGRREQLLRVRVVDDWGVPVAGVHVTFAPSGVKIEGQDVDPSSVGLQLVAGLDGAADVTLRGGRDIGAGSVAVSAGTAKAVVPIRIVPELRPLIVTGGGEVGVGATNRGSAAVAVRGSIGNETSLTLSYDSRRSGDVNDFFRRGQDLLDEGRYPTLGDGSQARAFTTPRQTVSARVERGLDWIELGDVQTADFGSGALNSYRRSLTGIAGRVTTGRLAWTGYGSFTDQVLNKQQLRADGSSGPYRFEMDVRPGTERVSVEVRARDNAARVISRQDLFYGSDYQIDYATGTLLLERPLPATDGDGNPVFLVAMLERRSGGDRRMVGGVAAELDLARTMRIERLDTLALTAGWAHDAGAGGLESGGTNIMSTGFRAKRSGLTATAELLRSQSTDSSAFAGEAALEWTIGERLTLDAGWLRVGDGFTTAADPRLRAGVEELRASALFRVTSATELRLSHERQSFAEQDIERERTGLQAVQRIGRRSVTGEASISNDGQGDGTLASSATARLKVAMSSQLDIWMESSRALSTSTNETFPGRPPSDQIGGGLSYRVRPGMSLELSHREVEVDSANYGISSLKLRGERILGGTVWTGVERAGGLDASHAAVLGWSPRLAFNGGWNVHAMFERRVGLDRAPLYDRARALPFAQTEQNRWTSAAGIQYLPSDSALSFSARGELQGGAERRGYRWDVAADMPVSQSLALITRHDWQASERMGEQWTEASRRERSLLGMAYRPVHQDALNILGKFEWRRDSGPLSGSTLGAGSAQARLIGAADVVWSPATSSELAGRYALRRSWSTGAADGGAPAASMAHFLGARAEQRVAGPVSLRLDGRMLLAGDQATVWAATPSLLLSLRNGLLVEGGYRLGLLQDVDFGATSGLFVTLGVRFSEQTGSRLADFWKRR